MLGGRDKSPEANAKRFSIRLRAFRKLCLALILLIATLSPLVNSGAGIPAGIVCIVPSRIFSCPSSPATFSGVKGQNLTVAVNIQGSYLIDDIIIVVKADRSILQPLSVDRSSSIMSGFLVTEECIDGVFITGYSSCWSVDVPGTVQMAFSYGQTIGPTTGRIFAINYKIVGDTSGITIGFQTGCAPPTSSFPSCVAISYGGGNPEPETLQTATFGRSDSYTITSNPSSILIVQGSTGNTTILLASLNYTGTVQMTASVYSPPVNGPSSTIVPNTKTLTMNAIENSTLFVSTTRSTPTGGYYVIVNASSGGLDQVLSVTIQIVSTPPPDFTLTANPPHLADNGYATVSINVTSVYNFAGAVSLQVHVLSGGINAVLDKTLAFLDANRTQTVTLTMLNHGLSSCQCTVEIQASSSGIVHTINVFVNIPSDRPTDLSYRLYYTQPAYPGGSVTFVNKFTDSTNYIVWITRVNLQLDFGAYYWPSTIPSSSQPYMQPGQSQVLNMTELIPGTASLGAHAITATIYYQFLFQLNNQTSSIYSSSFTSHGSVAVSLRPPSPFTNIVSSVATIPFALAGILASLLGTGSNVYIFLGAYSLLAMVSSYLVVRRDRVTQRKIAQQTL
jgi:hypothetical protein